MTFGRGLMPIVDERHRFENHPFVQTTRLKIFLWRKIWLLFLFLPLIPLLLLYALIKNGIVAASHSIVFHLTVTLFVLIIYLACSAISISVGYGFKAKADFESDAVAKMGEIYIGNSTHIKALETLMMYM